MFNAKRFIAVPDYSILQACNHTILCVGGAISIDRIYRKINGIKENTDSISMIRKKTIFPAIYIGRTKLLFTILISWMLSVPASWLIRLSHILHLHIANYSQKATLTNGLRTIHHFLKMYNLKEKQWIWSCIISKLTIIRWTIGIMVIFTKVGIPLLTEYYIRCSTLWSSAKSIDLYHFRYNIGITNRIIPDKI